MLIKSEIFIFVLGLILFSFFGCKKEGSTISNFTSNYYCKVNSRTSQYLNKTTIDKDIVIKLIVENNVVKVLGKEFSIESENQTSFIIDQLGYSPTIKLDFYENFDSLVYSYIDNGYGYGSSFSGAYRGRKTSLSETMKESFNGLEGSYTLNISKKESAIDTQYTSIDSIIVTNNWLYRNKERLINGQFYSYLEKYETKSDGHSNGNVKDTTFG